MPALDGATLLERCEQIWQATRAQERREALQRAEPPLCRLFDGEGHWQGEVAAEYVGRFEWIDNDTGNGLLEIPFDHYTARWIWDENGRIARGEKRNVVVTVDKDGARWSGLLQDCSVEKRSDGTVVLIARFLHDIEMLKHYSVPPNPFLPINLIQFPRVFMLAGGARWCLLLTLFLQVMREQTSLWTLPDDPLNPASWTSGLDMSNWSVVVAPHSFLSDLEDGILWSFVGSRFKNYFDLAKPIVEDAELSFQVRRYLDGDEPPWPGANLRNGCLVVDLVDKSGFYTGTSNGGNLWDGLTRTVANFGADFIDTTQSLIADTDIPDYAVPGLRRTDKRAPYVFYPEGQETGIQTSKFTRIPSTAIQINAGGQSMPGVNEAIRATIQAIGDMTAMIPGVPPVGGIADALISPLFMDTVLAWHSVKSPARATNSGWIRKYEYFQDGADKAYTLSALMVIREGFYTTRSRFAHELSIADGSPWLVGDQGVGHFFVGDRIGAEIVGDWTGTMYVDRVTSLTLAWDRDNPADWMPVIGDNTALKDPAQRAMERLEGVLSSIQQLGVFG
ncbi:phage tail protein [Rhodococcus jostii]|uniref:Gp37-like protein n=1 Tax=Rhodococcus jostii TaxID=132919 RepID=UPI00363DD845